MVSTSPASRIRREAAAGEASPSLEETVGEPSPWPDLGPEPLERCFSGRSHSSLRKKSCRGRHVEAATMTPVAVVAHERPVVGSNRTVASSAGDSVVVSGVLTEGEEGC